MQGRARPFGFLLAILVACGAAATARVLGLGPRGAPAGLGGVTALLQVLLVGRIALSLLPPGSPGGHGAPDLAATWAASQLLGLALLGIQGVALDSGLGALLDPIAGRRASLLAPWIVVLAARLALLPGAMVPRHAPREELLAGWRRALPLALAALLALAGWVALRAPRTVLAIGSLDATFAGSSDPLSTPLVRLVDALAPEGSDGNAAWLGAAAWAAAVVLLAHGLRLARRAPAQRLGAAMLVAATPLVAVAGEHAGELVAAAFLVAGASYAVGWLRRADRRARALALVSFAALPLATWNGLQLGGLGLAGLVVFTPRASRTALGAAALAAWFLVTWPLAGHFAAGLPADDIDWVEASFSSRLAALVDPRAFGLGALAVALGVLASTVLLARRISALLDAQRPPSEPVPGAIEEPLRELGFAVALAFGVGLGLLVGWTDVPGAEGAAELAAAWARLGVLVWLPLGALAAGLGLLRAEDSSRARGRAGAL